MVSSNDNSVKSPSSSMPPPCFKNPYLEDAVEMDYDPLEIWRTHCPGKNSTRYATEFQEIEKIGEGQFSHVYKVLKKIDGCLYAVKSSARQLSQDTERSKALMEVQAWAALGFHENIVAYYNSWFEDEQLYIQMELCDHSLSSCKTSLTEEQVLKPFSQIARALQYIHERGIAHGDVKPDNIIRAKNGIYKLGDFGCARLLDNSLPFEEGDKLYMPQEILDNKYDHLDKVDIYSLGVTICELLQGSPLTDQGRRRVREGKLLCSCDTCSRLWWIQIQQGDLLLENLLKIQFLGFSDLCTCEARYYGKDS